MNNINNMNIFIILLFFLLFIVIQLYFYKTKYNQNNDFIKNIESFESKLTVIDKSNMMLKDVSIELLLDQYNKLNNYLK
jgi:uncharacterized protein YxeA